MRRSGRGPLLLLCAALAGCGGAYRPPPPHTAFGRWPASGSLADARFAGFTSCISESTSMRCRRNGIFLLGRGPYNAAVDLAGSDGSGGFDQLTIWHDQDQYAVYAIGDALEREGWRSCYTGTNDRGDQAIYTRRGAAVKFSMDLSYWGKRRFRILPAWNSKERGCSPS